MLELRVPSLGVQGHLKTFSSVKDLGRSLAPKTQISVPETSLSRVG